MELSKDDPIFKLINQLKNDINDNNFVSLKFHNNSDWTEIEFNNFINVMRNNNYKEIIDDEYLEIYNNNNYLKIFKIANILNYCNTNNIENTLHKWENKTNIKTEFINDLFDVNLEFNVCKIENNNEIPSNWDNEEKHFKFIKKFNYELTNNIIATAIIYKSNNNTSINIKNSKIFSSHQKYEFEIIIKDIKNLLDNILIIIKALFMTNTILTKEQQTHILNEYNNLVRKDMVLPPYYKDIPLLTPKPITLEQVNLINPDEYGAISILKNYSVTEKADGERFLMYIDNNGRVYLISSSLKVDDTGIIAKKKDIYNSLIDGEYIICNKRTDNSKKNLFAAFDIYYLNNNSLTSLPLISTLSKENSRYNELLKIPNLFNYSNSDVEFIVKNHRISNDIINDCKYILDNPQLFPYDIDGLIFTPAKLAVYSFYPSMPVPITQNMGWDRLFKWKPPEQNTIDFLVEKGQERYDPITKQVLLEFKLYTGYNASQWEPITPLEGIRLRYDYGYAKSKSVVGEVYRAKLFKPISYYEDGVDTAWIPVNINGSCYASDGSLIDSKTIVEFAYNPDPTLPVSLRWKPLRVRTDKTRIFQKTGKLSKTANDLSVATSIWRSIHKPVTKEMLMDVNISPSSIPETLEERLLGTDDVYYAREIPRQHMLSVHMLNFHNQGIKKMLYEKPYKKDALLELACGMAGDLPRWRDGGYRFIMGVDLVKDNITNPRDGSYARMLRQRHAIKRIENGVEQTIYPDTVFVVGDCAKPLDTGAAADGIDDESKKILQILYRGNGANAPYYKYITRRASKGFNIVSCMFAVHYFFKNKDTLNGFLRNVSYNLRKDGIFIATFMDGNKVHEMLSESSTGVVEGRKLNNTVPVWAIIQRYNKNEWESGDYYGKTVEVFLENTNRTIPEYIVSLDHLTYMARMHGLVLQETALFSETYQKLYDSLPEDPTKRTRLDEDIIALSNDEVQKRFSFLNRWVVFKKI